MNYDMRCHMMMVLTNGNIPPADDGRDDGDFRLGADIADIADGGADDGVAGVDVGPRACDAAPGEDGFEDVVAGPVVAVATFEAVPGAFTDMLL